MEKKNVKISFKCIGEGVNGSKIEIKRIEKDGTYSLPSFNFSTRMDISYFSTNNNIIKYIKSNAVPFPCNEDFMLRQFVQSMELDGFYYKLQHDNNCIYITINISMRYNSLRFVQDHFSDLVNPRYAFTVVE